MNFSPEAELILCSLQTRIDASTAWRMQQLLQQDLNWSLLMRAALKHRITPLLQQTLSRFTTQGVEGYRCEPDAIPADIRASLQEHYALNLRRNLFLTGQLFTLLDAFTEQDILAIPYKGPIQGAYLYGNLASRQFIDVDILVPPSQAQRAIEVLVEQGFEAPSFLSASGEVAPFLLGQRHELALHHPKTQMVVELHWRTQGLHFSREFSADTLRGSLQSTQLQGRSVPIFAPEEMLLLLASHGVRHFWWRLQWLCDVARLVTTHSLNWDMIEQRVRSNGELRRLLIGLKLASQTLGATVPARILELCAADAQVERLATQIQGAWFLEPPALQTTEARLLDLLQTGRGTSSSPDATTPQHEFSSVALRLSNEALGATRVKSIKALSKANPEFSAELEQLRSGLMSNIEPAWNQHRVYLQMRERWRDKLRYLWWNWLAPSHKEIGLFRIPKSLHGLYIPARFIRLFLKYLLKPSHFRRLILHVFDRLR